MSYLSFRANLNFKARVINIIVVYLIVKVNNNFKKPPHVQYF